MEEQPPIKDEPNGGQGSQSGKGSPEIVVAKTLDFGEDAGNKNLSTPPLNITVRSDTTPSKNERDVQELELSLRVLQSQLKAKDDHLANIEKTLRDKKQNWMFEKNVYDLQIEKMSEAREELRLAEAEKFQFSENKCEELQRAHEKLQEEFSLLGECSTRAEADLSKSQ
jgi:predicted RNase H-like nuclease (RuvC/YqgF family)